MIVTIKKGPEITVIHYACSSNLVAEKFEHNVFTISCMQLDDKLESKGEREREREREREENLTVSAFGVSCLSLAVSSSRTKGKEFLVSSVEVDDV